MQKPSQKEKCYTSPIANWRNFSFFKPDSIHFSHNPTLGTLRGLHYQDEPYRQSKLAQVMFTFDLARELEGTGVIVSALHPASMMPTPLVLSRFGQSRATVEDGVEAVVNLVNLPYLEHGASGQYFDGLNPERANDQAYEEEAREKLRKLSVDLTDIGSY